MSTLLRKPQRLRTTKIHSSLSLSPITLGNRWRLSTRFTRVIQTPWSFHKSGWRASKNLYPSRSKASRVIDPPSFARTSPSAQEQGMEDFCSQSHFNFNSPSMLGKDLEESRFGVNAR
jgi:hypothetical protein